MLNEDQIDQCFSLSAGAYIVSWQDDEGEIVHIECEDDLTEAITYFSSGDDTQSSSGSILSFNRGRVTLEVTITIDYDGPSLSDTSSLASLEEYRRDSSSRRSFSLGSPSSVGELDDDSVTVSSRDHLGSSSSTFSHVQVPGPEASPQESATVSPTIHGPGTHESDLSSLNSSYRNGSGSHFSFHIPSDTPSTSASDINEPLSSAMERFPPNPSAVFERLKISEALGEEQSDWENASEEDRGARWLREQAKRAGGVDDFDLSDDEEDLDCLSLERNPSGHYYYTYNTTAGSQADCDRSLEASEDGACFAEPVRLQKPRPTTMQLEWVAAQKMETEEHRRLQESASQASLRSSNSGSSNSDHDKQEQPITRQDTSFDLKYYNLPAPPADIVTGCSSCGVFLELQRYICSTCGENRPISETKGKQTDTTHAFTYPPPQLSSSPSSSSSGSGESISSRIYQSLTQSPTSMFTSRTQLSPPTTAPRRESEERSGFELCLNCLEEAGISHSVEAGMGSPSSAQSMSGSSTTSLQMQQQDPTWKSSAPKKGHTRHSYIEKIWGEFGWEEICMCPVPLIPVSWLNVVKAQDEASVAKCSICSQTTESQRYKCAICANYNLCRGHYRQVIPSLFEMLQSEVKKCRVVHLLHPMHPFILVPDKPKFKQIGIEDLSEAECDPDEEHCAWTCFLA